VERGLLACKARQLAEMGKLESSEITLPKMLPAALPPTLSLQPVFSRSCSAMLKYFHANEDFTFGLTR
jgi:hypothetical protein